MEGYGSTYASSSRCLPLLQCLDPSSYCMHIAFFQSQFPFFLTSSHMHRLNSYIVRPINSTDTVHLGLTHLQLRSAAAACADLILFAIEYRFGLQIARMR